MIQDPAFYALAIPAVILFGLSKSGLGAALGIASVPLMSLHVSPLQAAAIMLPIIIAMDMTAVASYRRDFDATTLKIALPAGVAGVGIGWLTAAYVNDAHVRLIIGVIAVSFALNYWLRSAGRTEARPHNVAKGGFWSTVAGFTSFVSHSGGVPFQMYTLPLRFSPRVLVGTSVMFFTVINAVKLIPYFALGQFDRANLLTALALAPLAPLSIWAGVWLVRRIPMEPFYKLTYACVLIVGVKLIWDGVSALV